MGCCEDVLKATKAIVKKKGMNEFKPSEVIEYLQNKGTNFSANTIRSAVMSRCCANAPVHHRGRYGYFERTGKGIYKLIDY